jgi:hypothetical protein
VFCGWTAHNRKQAAKPDKAERAAHVIDNSVDTEADANPPAPCQVQFPIQSDSTYLIG